MFIFIILFYLRVVFHRRTCSGNRDPTHCLFIFPGPGRIGPTQESGSRGGGGRRILRQKFRLLSTIHLFPVLNETSGVLSFDYSFPTTPCLTTKVSSFLKISQFVKFLTRRDSPPLEGKGLWLSLLTPFSARPHLPTWPPPPTPVWDPRLRTHGSTPRRVSSSSHFRSKRSRKFRNYQ